MFMFHGNNSELSVIKKKKTIQKYSSKSEVAELKCKIMFSFQVSLLVGNILYQKAKNDFWISILSDIAEKLLHI